MKNSVVLIAFILITFLSHDLLGQTINYKVVKDEPYEPKISINLDVFNLDMNSEIKNIRLDNFSMNFGLFGYVKVIDNLEADFNVHKSWAVAGKLSFKDYPGNTELNGGVNFLLSNRTVKKNVKVILKQTVTRTTTHETTSTTYITVPATVRKRFGLRGGLYSKSGPFNYESYTDSEFFDGLAETKISSFGLYGGIISRSITNIIIKDDVYGRSMTSAGADFYLDALFVPVNRFKDLNDDGNNVTDVVKDYKSVMPFGFRVGYRTFQVEKKDFTGKKFGICGIGEFGYKPYQGWFITAGFGVTLVKH